MCMPKVVVSLELATVFVSFSLPLIIFKYASSYFSSLKDINKFVRVCVCVQGRYMSSLFSHIVILTICLTISMDAI